MCKIKGLILGLVMACFVMDGGYISAQKSEDAKSIPNTIELPMIPSDLREPEDRAAYLLLHYWDNLDAGNTGLSHDRKFMEQSFVDYLSVFPFSSSEAIKTQSFTSLLNRVKEDSDAFNIIKYLAEMYLNGHDSPMKSEEIYLLYLGSLASLPELSPIEKARLLDRIEMVSKNRIGSKATDFKFRTPDGMETSLSDVLPFDDRRVILIFFNPSCESCEEVIDRMKNNPDHRLDNAKIVAIYSGSDHETWMRKVSTFPEDWTAGINDGDIDDDELYYLPQMPTIYILDGNGLVMEKDARF